MATFAGFAVIGVAFFQFGVGIAVDRASPWESYLRTLPVGPLVRLAARLVSAALFALAAAAAARRDGRRDVRRVAGGLVLAGLRARARAGTVPFACLGFALGYWAPPQGGAAAREPALPRARVRRRAVDAAVRPPRRRRRRLALPPDARVLRCARRSCARARRGVARMAGAAACSRRSSACSPSPATGVTRAAASRDAEGAAAGTAPPGVRGDITNVAHRRDLFSRRRRGFPYTSTTLTLWFELFVVLIVLKIPVFYVGWVLWWAIKAEPELGADGGTEGVNWHPWRPRSPVSQPGGAIRVAPVAATTASRSAAPAAGRAPPRPVSERPARSGGQLVLERRRPRRWCCS